MNGLIIFNIGYGCAFIALAIKEVFWLRIILHRNYQELINTVKNLLRK